MKKDEQKYLSDMLQYSREARAVAHGVDVAVFQKNRVMQLALVHLVQIIGEAATRISSETRATYPDVSWNQITGIRHRLVHDYGNVSYEVVWDAVQNDLPPLIAALEKLTPPAPPSA